MDSSLSYPIPADELQRLRDLERYGVIDSPSDEHFERIVELASLIFAVPITAISLVDQDRQWFLCNVGLQASETPRDQAFCAHAIAGEGVMVVPDAALDPRFRSNPLVTAAPHIRFYAGAPLHSPEGHNLGTLCVIDRRPRQITAQQEHQLALLAQMVMHEIELRRQARLCPVTGLPIRGTFLTIGDLEVSRARREHQPLSLLCVDIDNLRLVNNRWGHRAGDQLLQDVVALLLVGLEGHQALELAERLREAVARLPGAQSHPDVQLHISGGLTSLASGDRDIEDLLRRADQALALAKTNGRNQIASLFAR